VSRHNDGRQKSAQSADRLRRIGVLYPFAKADRGVAAADAAFKAELSRLGWKEGGNLRIEETWMIADSARVQRARDGIGR
jgi:hypothetical protein